MSENPTRLEKNETGGLTLIPGDDEVGEKVRYMSEEEVAHTIAEMLVALKRAQIRVIPGGKE